MSEEKEDMIDNYKKLLEEAMDEIIEEMEDVVKDDDMEERVAIYKENPYEVIQKNVEQNYYQVIGNEIITITRGNGVCCLCSTLTDILYADNTYNSNIPVQICKSCIDAIMK